MKQKETIDYILVAIQVSIWNKDFSYLFIYLFIWDSSLLPHQAKFNISLLVIPQIMPRTFGKKGQRKRLRSGFCRGIDMWGRLGALAERFAVQVLYSYV